MASSGGTSSGSSARLQNSVSEKDLQQLMDQKKRKRMISNRESARRSRMKKQKQLDESLTQVSQLTNENNQILNNVNLTTDLYLKVEAENSILRAQVSELTHRLQALNDIITCLNSEHNYLTGPSINPPVFYDNDDQMMMMKNNFGTDDFMNPMDDWMYVNQPMLASSDLIMY